jgi:hypothetical protein
MYTCVPPQLFSLRGVSGHKIKLSWVWKNWCARDMCARDLKFRIPARSISAWEKTLIFDLFGSATPIIFPAPPPISPPPTSFAPSPTRRPLLPSISARRREILRPPPSSATFPRASLQIDREIRGSRLVFWWWRSGAAEGEVVRHPCRFWLVPTGS